MSNFAFLADEFPEIFALAREAERQGLSSPGAAAIYARKTVETLVKWLYRHDRTLRFPYEETLAALTHEPTFKALVGEAIFSKIRVVTKIGNRAAHDQYASNANLFAFSQDGHGNTIIGATNGHNNEAVVVQSGSFNRTWFTQVGNGNVIGVSQ